MYNKYVRKYKLKIQNPETNQLPQGVEIDDIKQASDSSGYPLQTIIAQNLLEKHFGIQDEWSYVDSQSNSLRTMDIVAKKSYGISKNISL